MYAVGECVWAHYLAVTQKTGRGRAFSLSAAQQQEVWVQYSALQIALQVSRHLQALVSMCVRQHLAHISTFCPRPSSGLSPESEKPPGWHFHLRTITHSFVSHIFFSGTVLLLVGFRTFLSFFSTTDAMFFIFIFQVNCDSDPYRKFMPLEPSFLITVICAKSNLCPTSLQCHNKTQQHLLQPCWIHSSKDLQVLCF